MIAARTCGDQPLQVARLGEFDEDLAAIDFDGKHLNTQVFVAAQAFAVEERERFLMQRASDLRRPAGVADDPRERTSSRL